MAMGKRRRRGWQRSMWVASSDLPRSAGHPFCERLNRVLDEAGIDAFVDEQCAKFYADGVGRPSLALGRYFRMPLLGYLEGLDSERAIALTGRRFAEPAAVPRRVARRSAVGPLDGIVKLLVNAPILSTICCRGSRSRPQQLGGWARRFRSS